MAINRWIGRATALRACTMFLPRNVGASDRFQLTSGALRYGATYPSLVPEQDRTPEDRARRIVESIVSAASETQNLGGGLSEGMQFTSTLYNGYPAVCVVGESDGRPVSLIPSATNGSQNTILVQEVQVGSNGSDYIFRLVWPNTPTLGTWAIAANGKKPVLLPYNATSEQLRSALLSFALPCRSIHVSGDHTLGYKIRLIEPTAKISTPPVLFPIVPVGGQPAIVEITFFEAFSYRFGPEGIAYQAEGVFEASITDAEMMAYLSKSILLGALAAEVTVSSRRIEPSYEFLAGVVFRFEFASKAAYDAFMTMPKTRLNYTWTAMPLQSSSVGFARYQNVDISGAISWTKVRQYVTPKNGNGGTYNPLNRSFHTRAWLGATPNATFVLNPPIPGYDSSLVQARPHSITWMGSNIWRVEVSTSWSALGESWTLAPGEVTTSLGIHTSSSSLEVSILADGSGDELGVNNNAGYTIETVGVPGIINQEVVLSPLDGDFQSLYQFESDSKRSHAFTGASTLELVRDAAESLWGAGNVVVSRETGDYFLRLSFVGKLSESVVDAKLYKTLADGLEVSVDIAASTPMKAWVLRYRFTGGICSGQWRFSSESAKTPAPTRSFPWLSPSDITAQEILAAIKEVSADYVNVLEVSDITVVSEDVGRKSVLREFTIQWQAQPSAAFTGPSGIPFWLGLETQDLKTAEPSLVVESHGQIAQPEIQVVALSNSPTSGQWQLSYGTKVSGPISWNASSTAVQTALQAIGVSTSVLGGNGGPYRVRWSLDGPREKLQGINLNLAKSGTPVFEAVVIEVGTGPKHFNNPDNWSLERTPIDGDDVIFADGKEACSYAIEVSAAIASIDIYRSYAGRIGLPEIQEDGSVETLSSWMTLSKPSSNPLPIRIGLGDSGEGPVSVRISLEDRPFDASVLFSQTGLTQKSIAFKGTHASNKLVCISGDIALGVRPEDIALCKDVSVTPSPSAGDTLTFASGASSKIDSLMMLGGTATLGSPPRRLAMRGGAASINGSGTCEELDISNASVRWLASGTLGKSQIVSGVTFGPSGDALAYSPSAVRLVAPAHGLASGERIYVRAYSGVMGIDGQVFAVSLIDANTFELVASKGTGTLVGYEGTIAFGIERALIVRDEGVLDFDSDGRTRDIVAPIVIQGTGRVSDSKVSVRDLRLWPELVEAFGGLGLAIEIRRIGR